MTVKRPDQQERALAELVAGLRSQSSLLNKCDLQLVGREFPLNPFPHQGPAALVGDDAALVPATGGQDLLLACDGIDAVLAAEDPWFAGWSAVLVNLSDIAAMGGRPIALVNSLWSGDTEPAGLMFAGMAAACERFAVPMVGGHTNLHSPYAALAVAVLGRLPGPPLSVHRTRPGDELLLLVNIAGRFHRHYPFWDAASEADPTLLRRQLKLPSLLATRGLVQGAKDISMGGLGGTAVMYAETARLGLEIDLEAIHPPRGVGLERWLHCFPSFGFLLSCRHGQRAAIGALIGDDPTLELAPIGQFAEGSAVRLRQGEHTAVLWDWGDQPLMGLAPPHPSRPVG